MVCRKLGNSIPLGSNQYQLFDCNGDSLFDATNDFVIDAEINTVQATEFIKSLSLDPTVKHPVAQIASATKKLDTTLRTLKQKEALQKYQQSLRKLLQLLDTLKKEDLNDFYSLGIAVEIKDVLNTKGGFEAIQAYCLANPHLPSIQGRRTDVIKLGRALLSLVLDRIDKFKQLNGDDTKAIQIFSRTQLPLVNLDGELEWENKDFVNPSNLGQLVPLAEYLLKFDGPASLSLEDITLLEQVKQKVDPYTAEVGRVGDKVVEKIQDMTTSSRELLKNMNSYACRYDVCTNHPYIGLALDVHASVGVYQGSEHELPAEEFEAVAGLVRNTEEYQASKYYGKAKATQQLYEKMKTFRTDFPKFSLACRKFRNEDDAFFRLTSFLDDPLLRKPTVISCDTDGILDGCGWIPKKITIPPVFVDKKINK